MTDKPTTIPDLFDRWFDANGRPTSDAYIWLKQVDKVLRLNTDFVDTPVIDPEYELVETWTYVVPYVENKTYPAIILDADFAMTILEATSKCASGTCTAAFSIDGTPLGGTANSVSSTEQTRTHSSANAVAVGQDVTFTTTSNSSCVDMILTLKTTRTLTT